MSKSIMPSQAHFARVPGNDNITRSSFNRDKMHKTTFDAGLLIPFFADEILPGDTMRLKHNLFARLATPIKPIMDNMYMDVQYFFIPTRLVWNSWKKFNGQQNNPGDSIDFTIPQWRTPTPNGSVGFRPGTVADYLGLPLDVDFSTSNSDAPPISALFYRCYNRIWNDWYRDQNLQDEVTKSTGAGPDENDGGDLLRRGKRHDYFTSCLPEPQRGDAVSIALTGDVPVQGSGRSLGLIDNSNEAQRFGLGRDSGEQMSAFLNAYDDPIGDGFSSTTEIATGGALGVTVTGVSGLVAKLSEATAIEVNSIRLAFATQQLLEIDARSGTRYIEIIKGHFGVVSPDFRLQRTEYLGGSSDQININEVAQTSSSPAVPAEDDTEQGNLAAFGTVSSSNRGFTKSFTEHGMILGLVSIRADLTYQRGIPKMFARETRYDFYLPVFAHLGEQAVLNSEIFAQATTDDAGVFGYQERWAEMRYSNNLITGLFRSDLPAGFQSLDIWHLSEDFTGLPILDDSFIEENPPLDRVVAVPSEPKFIFDSYLDIKHVRVMPTYSVPGLKRL